MSLLLIICTCIYISQTAIGQCPDVSPYVLSIGRGIDATTANMNLYSQPENQFVNGVPMKRTPGKCWNNAAIWNEVTVPQALPDFTDYPDIASISSYADFKQMTLQFFNVNDSTGLMSNSLELGMFANLSLYAGSSRMTSQALFSSFMINTTSAEASDDLIAHVSKLCIDWTHPLCWKQWVSTFADPLNGFGTHYVSSDIMGGNWNYMKYTSYNQVNYNTTQELYTAAEDDVLFSIHNEGCSCGYNAPQPEWYMWHGVSLSVFYGGTQRNLCAQNIASAWQQCIAAIPSAPASASPTFAPIYNLFNETYASLKLLYKTTTNAYLVWAEIESVRGLFALLLDYVYQTQHLLRLQCVVLPCPYATNCTLKFNNLTSIESNLNKLIWSLDETLVEISTVLNDRNVTGYDISTATTLLDVWREKLIVQLDMSFKKKSTLYCSCNSRMSQSSNDNYMSYTCLLFPGFVSDPGDTPGGLLVFEMECNNCTTNALYARVIIVPTLLL